jgi:hypothetical protein
MFLVEPVRRRLLYMNPAFFSKAPIRSYFLWADCALLFAVTCITGFVLVRHWRGLPASTVYYLGLSIVAMFVFWIIALQGYSEIHRLYIEGKIPDVATASSTELILRVAATVTQVSLFVFFFVVGLLVMQIDTILRSH